MGHYDDCYEADDDRRAEELKASYRKAAKQLKKFMGDLPVLVLPQRFEDMLTDLGNHFKVNS